MSTPLIPSSLFIERIRGYGSVLNLGPEEVLGSKEQWYRTTKNLPRSIPVHQWLVVSSTFPFEYPDPTMETEGSSE